MKQLSSQQLRSINSLIKKELKKIDEEFIYFKDLHNKLEVKLKSFTNPPFTSIASLTEYFKELEERGRLNEIPYLYRENPGDQWRFYKLSSKPLVEYEKIEPWINELKDAIEKEGFVHIPDREMKEETRFESDSLANVFSDLPEEFIMAGELGLTTLDHFRNLVLDPTYPKVDLVSGYIKKLEHTAEVEKRLEFFKRNLGDDSENTLDHRRLILQKIMVEKYLESNCELKVFGDVLYLDDVVHIVQDVPTFLYAIKKVSKSTKKEIFYRGQGKYFWDDVPSLYRDEETAAQEHRLFKEIILKNPEEFLNHQTTFEKLAKMQHYELPTRLMDITSNPLVALYFAVSNADHDNVPSEVILYECETEKIKYYDSDHVSVLSNLAQREKHFDFLDRILSKIEQHEKKGKDAVTSERLLIDELNDEDEIQYLYHTIRGEKPYFQEVINPRHLNSSVIVKSKLDNERIRKQDGAFIIVGIDRYSPNRPAPINLHLKNEDEQRIRIIIAEKDDDGHNVAKVIRGELDSLGFNRGSLFPEIMNSAKYIRDKYIN